MKSLRRKNLTRRSRRKSIKRKSIKRKSIKRKSIKRKENPLKVDGVKRLYSDYSEISSESEHNLFFEIINLFHFSDNIIAFHGCELTYGIFMDKNAKIIELTNIGHLESWWNQMQNKFIKFGLKYSRLEVPTINKNLYLDDAICENIINSLTLKQIDYIYKSWRKM